MVNEEIEPDLETLREVLPEWRRMTAWERGDAVYAEDTREVLGNRIGVELSLLNVQTSERAHSKGSKSI